MGVKDEQTIYHDGLAEAFGVSHEEMENMSLREMAERAYEMGGELRLETEGGIGPGLTLRAEEEEAKEA